MISLRRRVRHRRQSSSLAQQGSGADRLQGRQGYSDVRAPPRASGPAASQELRALLPPGVDGRHRDLHVLPQRQAAREPRPASRPR